MRGDDTRQKLRQAALALFVERGIAETTTKLLAERAGIAEGTIYRHFASKDDLVHDLFEHYYVRFATELRAVEAGMTGGIDVKLSAMIRYICDLYDSDPVLYRFLLLAQYQAIPIIQTIRQRPTAIFRTLIETAIARGDIPQQNAQITAAMMLGAIIQPAMGLIYSSYAGRMADFQPQIAQACSAILRAPERGQKTR